ncbi:sterol desaturase family protein [Aspergillus tanneri]|uniref:Fatty acid hydroxylase domain-containing protein n=1 Tax=Aspergillus tanneri TaxID=1220188 RepID=A0A5M9MLU3_9EURO|nr:uncharacterized protein ATNIH1004_003864 [Aspergillus tanneri]KAA8647981.1 hypothetical protein ATNIH1004_003864 [Aspergillus tanneri]
MSTSLRNPKDSMKSTWNQQDRGQWTTAHWMLKLLGLDSPSSDKDKSTPVHEKSDKVPYAPELQFHIWVLIHALVPLSIHYAYIAYFGRNMSAFGAFFFYSFAFKAIAIHQLHVLRRLGNVYGFFDGDKHERDGVPDIGVRKVVNSLLSVATFRPMMTVFVAYQINEGPTTINWLWLPLTIGIYGLILDFWFYWYHRIMHDTDSLWQYHRTHHLTKHPNPLLTIYADSVQEVFDIVGIPMMAYISMKLVGFPFSFYDWWISQQYVVFTEILGHSGLRMEATSVSTLNWLWRFLDAELVIEDHDLHHRKGWRKSHNYGKQTRVWDRLFGTCHPRIEGHKDNIDYVNTVTLPLI